MAEWQNGRMAEWLNGGMAEWYFTTYLIYPAIYGTRQQHRRQCQQHQWLLNHLDVLTIYFYYSFASTQTYTVTM